MSLKEIIHRKKTVDRLAGQVIASIGSVSGGYKVDKTDMRALLETAGYESQTRRGIEMHSHDFSAETPRIVVLDNELKLYETDMEDIAVRKNPTLGEMVRLKSIRKILSDQDVVVASRSDTVRVIRKEILESMDLSFTEADIGELYREGWDALDHGRGEDLVAILEMFAEILVLSPPDAHLPGDLVVFGNKNESEQDLRYGPLNIYSYSGNLLHRYNRVLSAGNSKNPGTYRDLLFGEAEPDMEGVEVLDDLRQKAIAIPEKTLRID